MRTWPSSTSAARAPNESKVMNIIGDVKGRTCVLIDDMVDTAGTLCAGAQALKDEGALKVVAYITHAGAVRQGRREDHEVGARRAGGDRHHPAVGGGEAVRTHPAAVGGGVAGRDHPSHPRRGVASARCTSTESFVKVARTGRGVRCVASEFGVNAMRISFEVGAESRDDQGKGASRRLRHSGKVPAILYGGTRRAPCHRARSAEADDADRQREVLLVASSPSRWVARRRPPSSRTCRCIRHATPSLHVDLQRVRRDREDPHPPADPLQGRGRFARA